MGILNEFFAADPAELRRVDVNRGVASYPGRPATKGRFGFGGQPAVPPDPGPGLPYVDFGRLTGVELGTLEEILTGRPYDEIVEDPAFLDQVLDGGDEGPWVSQIRRALTDALRDADDPTISSAAERWAATEEIDAAGDPEVIEALRDLLVALRGLAREATGERELYMWTSL